MIEKHISKADLGWTAGIIDGEGCISIVIRNRRKKTNNLPEHQLHIYCQSKTKSMQDKLRCLWGGSVLFCTDKRQNRADTWKWCIVSKDAALLLSCILPYLVVKKDHAKLALLFRKSVDSGSHFLSVKDCELREKLYGDMRKLNRRGKIA